MPRPAGQHSSYDRADRVQWRTDNVALIEWLAPPAHGDGSAFIASVQDDLRYYGSLTDAQTAALLRMMNAPQASVVGVDAAAEAGENDALGILNGVYTLNDGTEHLTYRIHTVLRGPLQGKRIVKIQQQYGEFKGFAFLRTDGHLKVWRRFAEDERRGERYIVWAGILLSILRSEFGTDEAVESINVDGTQFEVQRSLTCRRCNRPLTVPSSIDAGLGPECAQREGSRTTAARQHEQVATPVEEDTEEPSTEVQVDAAAQEVVEDQDADLSQDSIRSRLGVLGGTRDALVENSPTRERMARLYNMLTYWNRERCCLYCGRTDFESRRGCTTHTNNYCNVRRTIQNAQNEARRISNAARLAAQLEMAMANPNRSALGTVIDGEVWLQ